MLHYPEKRLMLMRRMDVLARAAMQAYNRRNRDTLGRNPQQSYQRAMRQYALFCRRWRRANRQLIKLDADAPLSLPSPYSLTAARQILHYFRHLEDERINQARSNYLFHADIPRHELLPPDDHCIGVHLAFILESPPRRHSFAARYLHYKDGAHALVIASQPDRTFSVGGEQLVYHLLNASGAPFDPFTGATWQTHPYAVFQRFFQQLA